MMARRVTIVDVATRAGVSTAAASKVLRNAYGVSDQMRERVEKAIQDLGYRPLAAARGMRGKTFTIGVLVSDMQNPFFGVLIEGVSAEVEASGYELLVGPAGAGARSQSRMVDAMVDRQMDGLILISPMFDDESLARTARLVPTVVIGRHGPAEAYDTVANDDIAGSGLIVDHLVSLGHTRIGYLGHADPEESDPRLPQQVRERGYREAMVRHGLGEHIDVVPGRWTNGGGRAGARDLLARRIRPTAIHGGADVAALGVLTELIEKGVSVPGDMSVVGYDNTTTATLPQISLTSVDQSGSEMGRMAARLLLERFEGRTDSQHFLTAPHLVARRTSGVPSS